LGCIACGGGGEVTQEGLAAAALVDVMLQVRVQEGSEVDQGVAYVGK
jgi:hypothetical protein